MKAGQVMVAVFKNAALSGISTMKPRYSSVKPSARSKPGSTLCCLRRVREKNTWSPGYFFERTMIWS